jgi:hypothetical protein
MFNENLSILPQWVLDDLDHMLARKSRHSNEFDFKIEYVRGSLGSIRVTSLSSSLSAIYSFVDGSEWVGEFDKDLQRNYFGATLKDRLRF